MKERIESSLVEELKELITKKINSDLSDFTPEQKEVAKKMRDMTWDLVVRDDLKYEIK